MGVGQLVSLLRQSLGRAFTNLVVTGEVLDPLLSQRGHLYFRLTDGQSEVRAVMWQREAGSLRQYPQPGDKVTLRCKVDIYAPRGDLQLVVLAMMQSGRGQKLQELSQLKARLKADGLLDRPRRELPRFARTVGLVTSAGSAVLHDIYQTVQKRFPSCQLVLSPSSVSGQTAPAELLRALQRLKDRVEVVIIARGGGSFEELLPFSDEALVRSVAVYPHPVVAAVGHGSDGTLLDLVADHTAPTPTAAAVLVTPDLADLKAEIHSLRKRMSARLLRECANRRSLLSRATAHCRAYHPRRRVAQDRESLDRLRTRLARSLQGPLQRRRTQLESLALRLRSAGPSAILERGFALVQSEHGPVTSSRGRTPGEELELHFADGRLVVEIKRVLPALRCHD